VSQQSVKLEGAANESFEMRLTPRSASRAGALATGRTDHDIDTLRNIVDARVSAPAASSTTQMAIPAVAMAPSRFAAMFSSNGSRPSSRSGKQNTEKGYSTRSDTTSRELGREADGAMVSDSSQFSDGSGAAASQRVVEMPWKPPVESLAHVARLAEGAFATRSRAPGLATEVAQRQTTSTPRSVTEVTPRQDRARTPRATTSAPPEGRQFSTRGRREGPARSPGPTGAALDHELDALDWRGGKHAQPPEREVSETWLGPVTLGPVKIWHPFAGNDGEDSSPSIFSSF